MARPTTKKLFTPGPLTTSESVKQAMLRDVGSRDAEFVDLVRNLREALLEIAGVSQEDGYEAVIVQGSGTFGLEAVISSVIPPDGKLLVATNGVYGDRLDRIAGIHGIPRIVVRSAEDAPLCQESIRRTLLDDPAITHVAMVHCETSTGMLNAVEELAHVVASAGRRTIVDSMSGFAAVPIDLKSCPFDYLVSSVSKGLEGVPGASFVLCRRAELQLTAGWARTLSLDLFEQWRGLERNGQFRFTPPTHVLLAAHQAVLELGQEGGVAARAARYRANHRTLVDGMRALGFETYLPDELQSAVITTFACPTHANFSFQRLYDLLSDKGFLIYPGKISTADCFRIGTIGRLFPRDVRALLDAIREALVELDVPVPE